MDLEPDAFDERFGTDQFGTAVRVRVTDLDQVNRILDVAGVARIERTDAILAYPKSLDSVFEFFRQ